MAFDLTKEESQLLLQIGLLAAGQNRFLSATQILMALEAFRQGEESLDCAKAFLCLSQQAFQVGLEYIDGTALPRRPDSGMLQAFRGLALLRLQRNSEANQALQAAIASKDPAAANLANGLLKELQ